MKKKILATVLTSALCVTALAGCTNGGNSGAEGGSASAKKVTAKVLEYDLTEEEYFSDEVVEEIIDDEGVPLDPGEIPEEEDCSDDTVPIDASGKKKVKIRVPDLVSMTDVLFERKRRDFYFFLWN